MQKPPLKIVIPVIVLGAFLWKPSRPHPAPARAAALETPTYYAPNQEFASSEPLAPPAADQPSASLPLASAHKPSAFAKASSLSDSDRLVRAVQSLSVVGKKFDRRAEARRVQAIGYLASAVHWNQNPARPAILSAIEQLLAKRDGLKVKDWRQRRSVAGDKRELFEILLRDAPERAAELDRRYAHSWLAPILKASRQRFDAYNRVAAHVNSRVAAR